MRATAAEWSRRSAAGLSAPQREEFRRWLAADPRHGAALAQVRPAADDCDWMWHAGAVDEIAAGLAQRKIRRRRRRLVASASVTAGLLLLLVALPNLREREPGLSSAAVALTVVEPARRVLPDGSVIELRNDADVAIEFTPALRRVVLRGGEAHFQVFSDASRPFVVSSRGVEVRAVGTAFAVQVAPTDIEVMVTEGRVAVAAEEHSGDSDARAVPGRAPRPAFAAFTVDAGNRVNVPAAPEPAMPPVVPMTEKDVSEKLGWRIPRIEFTASPLREVVARLNAHNRVQLAFDDPSLGDLRISGVLRADRFDSLLEMLEADFGVKAEARGEWEFRLSRKP